MKKNQHNCVVQLFFLPITCCWDPWRLRISKYKVKQDACFRQLAGMTFQEIGTKKKTQRCFVVEPPETQIVNIKCVCCFGTMTNNDLTNLEYFRDFSYYNFSICLSSFKPCVKCLYLLVVFISVVTNILNKPTIISCS